MVAVCTFIFEIQLISYTAFSYNQFSTIYDKNIGLHILKLANFKS